MTDLRPELAANLAMRLAPAADALSASYLEDYASSGPAPEDDHRAHAAFHQTGRAMLAHLRQLLAVLDWSARLQPAGSRWPDDPPCSPAPPELW